MEAVGARVFAGVDWASQEHEVCVLSAQGERSEAFRVSHTGGGLAALGDRLLAAGGGQSTSVWVAIEVPHGPVVESLLERGFRVFAINPKQLSRFRDRFTVSGAKDDRRDAYVLAQTLRTDTALYREIHPHDPTAVQLREWSRTIETLTKDRLAEANRVRDLLRRYFPQYLTWSDDAAKGWFLDLWEEIPTPEHAMRKQLKTVERILRRRRIRKLDAAEVLRKLQEQPLDVAPGTVEAVVGHLELCVEKVRFLNGQIRRCERKLDELLKRMTLAPAPEPEEPMSPGSGSDQGRQSDGAILLSCPGIGRIVLAALLAEAAGPLRDRDYHGLRTLCGVAPVTQQSGRRRAVAMRRACHRRLRNAMYYWANNAIKRGQDPRSRQTYTRLRSQGHSHSRALRGVGDRLLAMACAMLRTGLRYHREKRVPQTAP